MNRRLEGFAVEFGRSSFQNPEEQGGVRAGRRGDKMGGGGKVAERERESVRAMVEGNGGGDPTGVVV